MQLQLQQHQHWLHHHIHWLNHAGHSSCRTGARQWLQDDVANVYSRSGRARVDAILLHAVEQLCGSMHAWAWAAAADLFGATSLFDCIKYAA